MTASELAAIKRRVINRAATRHLTPSETDDATALTVDLYRAAAHYGATPADCDAITSFTDTALDIIRAQVTR